eukprot:UN06593
MFMKIFIACLLGSFYAPYQQTGDMSYYTWRRWWNKQYPIMESNPTTNYVFFELPEIIDELIYGKRYVQDYNRLDSWGYQQSIAKDKVVIFLNDGSDEGYTILSEFEKAAMKASTDVKEACFGTVDYSWKSGEYMKTVHKPEIENNERIMIIREGNVEELFEGEYTAENIVRFVQRSLSPLITELNGLADSMIQQSVEQGYFVVVGMVKSSDKRSRLKILTSMAEYYRNNEPTENILFMATIAGGWQNMIACYHSFEPFHTIFPFQDNWSLKKFKPWYKRARLPAFVHLNFENYD